MDNDNIKSHTAVTYLSIKFFKNVIYVNNCQFVNYIIVPHSQSGVVPMSSLSGVGQLGFWEFGMGGTIGEGWGKWGQSTSNLRRGRTVPVTAGGRQVSERVYKRDRKGSRGNWKRGKREPRHVYM
jgi:hypothetical protein